MSLFVTPAPKVVAPPALDPQAVAPSEFIALTAEQLSARKRRNLMLALSILAFVALVFFITIARLKAGASL